jgi:Immunity protein 31
MSDNQGSVDGRGSAPLFEFHEVTVVASQDHEYEDIWGARGVVVGRERDDSGRWIYAVYIYTQRECWCLWEHDLRSTGSFEEWSRFMSDTHLRVNVRGELLPGGEEEGGNGDAVRRAKV